MARSLSARASTARASITPTQPPAGTIRTCVPYRGEIARHRVISADGYDYAVATTYIADRQMPYTTGAYPVSRGYLVMVRQPLYEVRSAAAEAAHEQHEQLINVLANAGVRIVRARRALAARQRTERGEARETGATKSAPAPVARA
jgi:hypothetical protein